VALRRGRAPPSESLRRVPAAGGITVPLTSSVACQTFARNPPATGAGGRKTNRLMTLYNKKDTKTYSLISGAHGSDMNHPPPPDSPKCCRADAPAVSHPDEWHVEKTGMLIENIPPCVPSRCQSLVMPVVSGSRLSPRTAPGLRFHLWSFLTRRAPTLKAGFSRLSAGYLQDTGAL